MSTPVATREESDVSNDELPAEYSLASGFAAYVLGFALTYFWVGREVETALSGLNAVATVFGSSGVPTWKAVGWVFYSAHLVALEIPLPGGTISRNLLAAQGSPVALYLVPPVMLVIGGWIAAKQARTLPDVRAGARAGATIVVGYVVIAAAGAFVFSVDAFGSTVGPDLLGAAAVAGLLYPVVFGALGGALAVFFD